MWGQREKAPRSALTPCTHPPSKSLGSNCLVPMATRQSVTSKFFQPPGTTPSLTEDNRKPQVLKQRMEPTSNSLLEVPTDLLICILVLPTEPKGQRGALRNTWKKLGPYPSGTGQRKGSVEKMSFEKQRKYYTFLPASKPTCIYSGLAFKPLQAVLPLPLLTHTDCSRCPYSTPSLLCLSILNAFLQPPHLPILRIPSSPIWMPCPAVRLP